MSISSFQSILIVDGLRTAIGSPFRSLRNFSAAKLAASVIEHLVKRNQINPKGIQKVILGNVVSAGIGQNLARQSAILAGLPVTTEAFTVNHVCASGLQSIIIAMHALWCEDVFMIAAGGAESASNSPILCFIEDGNSFDPTKQVQSLVNDGLLCKLTGQHMGQLCERLAKVHRITRQQQDVYAWESHQKACVARQARKFAEEIVPISVSSGQHFENDERPRRNIDQEKLLSLLPVFDKKGTITAGNSSVPCDGAAGVILVKEKEFKQGKKKAWARILGYSSIAVSPQEVFSSGIDAIRVCLKKCGLTMQDVHLFEVSESFAAQAILTRDKVRIPEEKMNIWGGDIAIGHPLGAAGIRCLVTLLHNLKEQEKEIGVVCSCLGGGGAIAMAVERIY